MNVRSLLLSCFALMWLDSIAANIGKFRNEGQKTFLSPTPGEQLDWILVIDDASKGYPKPGSKEYKN